jgi:hypothetical protein
MLCCLHNSCKCSSAAYESPIPACSLSDRAPCHCRGCEMLHPTGTLTLCFVQSCVCVPVGEWRRPASGRPPSLLAAPPQLPGGLPTALQLSARCLQRRRRHHLLLFGQCCWCWWLLLWLGCLWVSLLYHRELPELLAAAHKWLSGRRSEWMPPADSFSCQVERNLSANTPMPWRKQQVHMQRSTAGWAWPCAAIAARTCTNSDTCPTAAATKPTMSSPADVACTEARHSHLHARRQECCC